MLKPTEKLRRPPEAFEAGESGLMVSQFRHYDNFARTKEELVWTIEKFILAGSITLISGPPAKSWKSWTAMAMAMATASGKAVGPFVPAAKRKVLYIEREGTYQGNAKRYEVVCNGMGYDFEQFLADTDDSFYLAHKEDIDLSQGKRWEQLAEWGAMNDVGLFIIDTYARHLKGNENDSEITNAAVRNLDILTRYDAAVIVIHHITKDSGDREKDMDTEVRGSGALIGGIHTHLALRPYHTSNCISEAFWHMRANDLGEKTFTAEWRLNKVDPDRDELRREDSAVLEVISGKKKSPQTCLESLSPVKDYTIKQLISIWSMSMDDAEAFCEQMVSEGKLEKTGVRYKRKEKA